VLRAATGNLKNKANFRERQKLKGKRKNESKSGVYSCSPREIGKAVISRGEFVVKLKKQSQFAIGVNRRKVFFERRLWQ
jgi:hypothetical protein